MLIKRMAIRHGFEPTNLTTRKISASLQFIKTNIMLPTEHLVPNVVFLSSHFGVTRPCEVQGESECVALLWQGSTAIFDLYIGSTVYARWRLFPVLPQP